MNQAVAIVAASAVFIAVLAVCEWSSRRFGLDSELARKIAHISSGVLAACLPLVMTLYSAAIVAALFIPFMLISRSIGLFPSVHRAEPSSLGEIYFPLGVMAAALFAPSAAAYSYGVLVMGLSDAFASLAGTRYGKRSYRLPGAHKTYLGSAVFLATTLVLAFGTLAALGRLSARTILAACLVSLALTVTEGFLGKGLDNAALPVAGALLFQLIY